MLIDNQKVFCFWTSDNPMSSNRKQCLQNLRDNIGFEIIFVTKDNLYDFILKEEPLPNAYKYLSAVHKTDYLRCYFMHHYGGGYSDIKKTTGSWKSSWNTLINNDNVWISGYKEVGPGGVAHKDYTHLWESLIGNCCYICKPKTPFTYEWYEALKNKIKQFSSSLEKFPAAKPRDKKEDYKSNSCYPIEWNEILGRIFHPLIYKYKDHVDMSLPKLIFKNYQ